MRRELRGRQERVSIVARQVRYRDDLAFAPQQVVRETRDVAHVNARAHDAAAGAHPSERRRDEFADGGKQNCAVESDGQRFVRVAWALPSTFGVRDRQCAAADQSGAHPAQHLNAHLGASNGVGGEHSFRRGE